MFLHVFITSTLALRGTRNKEDKYIKEKNKKASLITIIEIRKNEI